MLRRVALSALAGLALAACARSVPEQPPSKEQTAIANWVQGFRASDAALQSELVRLQQILDAGCPGAPAPLAPSPGLAVRDGLRVIPVREVFGRIEEDLGRESRDRADRFFLDAVHQTALADWHLRRAAATQDAHFCAIATGELGAASTRLEEARGQSGAVVREARLPAS